MLIVVTKMIPLSSPKTKYIILFFSVMVFTFIGVTITYHVVIMSFLPFLYGLLYSSRRVMWYVCSLTVISTVIIVYAGYEYGLCDANMVLLTASSLDKYLVDGKFVLTTVNPNTMLNLFMYFVVPRCLIYIGFMAVCNSIFRIIKSNFKNEEHVMQLEVFQKELKDKVDEQTKELLEQQRKLEEAYLQTVSALSEAVDAKDRYTSGHSKRVAQYSRMIAERMGKSVKEQEQIYQAGLLHDVGKIGIPVDIINKPGKLTDEEYELIKIHPVTGYHILRQISEQNEMAVAAKYHHERYDGKGYPNGLSGENIPELSRILGVADSYDAMTSNRSYRKGLPQEVVRSELEKGKGTQFDPDIADIMLQMIEEDTDYILRQKDIGISKILVISHDEELYHQIQSMLQEESIYELTYAKNLEEILVKLENESIKLILLEISKDQERGWKILKLVNEMFQIPIALISDDKNLRCAKEFKELGCDDYIAKPLSLGVMKETIYNMTKNSNE